LSFQFVIFREAVFNKEIIMQKNSVSVSGREVFFYFSEAVEENKPILFIMHGHGFNKEPTKFRSENWNVVFPVDDFGNEGRGSWFLGEEGDYFWLEAMQLILDKVRSRCGKGGLYFWGSSMGGYASILYGHLLRAKAVYANVPQTVLLGSRYSENGMHKHFSKVIDSQDCEYNDLKKVLNKRTRTKYFMCFNQLEGSDYFSEQGLSFISHLHSMRQPIYVEVRPTDSHGKNHGISEVIKLFKRY